MSGPAWSYPDAAAAGPAAATSAAASAACIYCKIIGGPFVPPYKYLPKYIQQKQHQTEVAARGPAAASGEDQGGIFVILLPGGECFSFSRARRT